MSKFGAFSTPFRPKSWAEQIEEATNERRQDEERAENELSERESSKTLGQIAWEAWREVASVDAERWEDVSPRVQGCWEVAADAVYRSVIK